MNLEIFPMDVQKCTMEVESFGYDMTNLIFEWQKTEPIQLKGSLQLPQFTIKGYRPVFFCCLLMTLYSYYVMALRYEIRSESESVPRSTIQGRLHAC